MSTCKRLILKTLGISTNYAKKSPRTLLAKQPKQCVISVAGEGIIIHKRTSRSSNMKSSK